MIQSSTTPGGSSANIKKTAALLLLVVGVVAGQDEREKRLSADGGKIQAVETLPEGPGRDLVLQTCSKCHDLKMIVSQRKTAAAWQRTVNEMLRLGARLNSDETEIVTNYLATWFGPDASWPLAPGPRSLADKGQEIRDKGQGTTEILPEGQGRNLILQACVQCHDVSIIISERKTAAGWRRTVNEMIWRGAPLMTDEAEAVINYLVARLGPGAAIPEPMRSR